MEIGRLSERIKDLDRKLGVEKDTVKRLTAELEDKRNENRSVEVRDGWYMVNPRRRWTFIKKQYQHRRTPTPRPERVGAKALTRQENLSKISNNHSLLSAIL